MAENMIIKHTYGAIVCLSLGVVMSGAANADGDEKKIKVVRPEAQSAKVVVAAPKQGVAVFYQGQSAKVVRPSVDRSNPVVHQGEKQGTVFQMVAPVQNDFDAAGGEAAWAATERERSATESGKNKPSKEPSQDLEPLPIKTEHLPPPPPRWIIPAGSRLRELLQSWCQKEGYQLSWEITDDIGFAIGGSIEGDFLEIVPEVLKAAAPVKYLAPLFQRQQKVLVVREVKR